MREKKFQIGINHSNIKILGNARLIVFPYPKNFSIQVKYCMSFQKIIFELLKFYERLQLLQQN